MEKVNQSEQELEQDFSKPWEQSDVILEVEGQQFHVHRVVLALSSPVFSRMFSADFKEKHAEKIPLPEKKAREIREMLLAIYPTSWKSVNENNCYFLLDLAEEYQVSKLTQKCENFLSQAVDKEQGAAILDTLIVAQKYTLEKVIDVCVKKTRNLSLQEIKSHSKYDEIEPLTQRKMIELQMSKVEDEFAQMKRLAGSALKSCASVIMMLGCHIRYAEILKEWHSRHNHNKRGPYLKRISLKENMEVILHEKEVPKEGHVGVCQSLYDVFDPLKCLHKSLMEMAKISQNSTNEEDRELNSFLLQHLY